MQSNTSASLEELKPAPRDRAWTPIKRYRSIDRALLCDLLACAPKYEVCSLLLCDLTRFPVIEHLIAIIEISIKPLSLELYDGSIALEFQGSTPTTCLC